MAKLRIIYRSYSTVENFIITHMEQTLNFNFGHKETLENSSLRLETGNRFFPHQSERCFFIAILLNPLTTNAMCVKPITFKRKNIDSGEPVCTLDIMTPHKYHSVDIKISSKWDILSHFIPTFEKLRQKVCHEYKGSLDT